MDTPKIKVPAGYEALAGDDGTIQIKEREKQDRLRKTIAFRLSGRGNAELAMFVESFPTKEVGTALRWLLDHPDVRTIMQDRVRSQTRRAT